MAKPKNDAGYLEDADHVSELSEGDSNWGSPSELMNPNLGPDGQDDEVVPTIVGPPGYASPDPATNMGRLRPVSEHPLADRISDDYGKDNLDMYDDDDDDDEDGLESKTKAELMEIAADHDIDGRSSMSKAELISALEESSGPSS